MSEYIAGEGYDKGYNCRMIGGQKPHQAQIALNPYWKEFSSGWDDADNKIMNEARERNACTKPKCCRKKDFIQD